MLTTHGFWFFSFLGEKLHAEEFERLFNEIVESSHQTLVEKAKEYATDDRLHNFKVAAAVQGVTPQAALAGFMAKHTVSLYDMCRSDVDTFTTGQWEEKLGDHLNYLILLAAIVKEGKQHLSTTKHAN